MASAEQPVDTRALASGLRPAHARGDGSLIAAQFHKIESEREDVLQDASGPPGDGSVHLAPGKLTALSETDSRGRL